MEIGTCHSTSPPEKFILSPTPHGSAHVTVWPQQISPPPGSVLVGGPFFSDCSSPKILRLGVVSLRQARTVFCLELVVSCVAVMTSFSTSWSGSQ